MLLTNAIYKCGEASHVVAHISYKLVICSFTILFGHRDHLGHPLLDPDLGLAVPCRVHTLTQFCKLFCWLVSQFHEGLVQQWPSPSTEISFWNIYM